jgi:NADH:ubiquinone oxidoreductase subunit 2 (subunit N)
LLLIGIGLFSGILGALFALAQHDLKRLLAYSSVENVGIITLGLGLGLTGLSHGSVSLVVLGFAGEIGKHFTTAITEAMQWRTSDKELSETANKAKQRGRPPRSDEAFTQPKK